MKKIILIIGFAALLVSPFANAASWRSLDYSVVKITDGDTMVLTDGNIKFKLRIAGMDAPERSQSYGKLATHNLKSLTSGKKIQVRTVGSGLDRYGRVLGIAFVNNKDIAKTMIKNGLATYYRPTCQDYPISKKRYNYDPLPYVKAETFAKNHSKNIWSDKNFELPCHYRKKNKR